VLILLSTLMSQAAPPTAPTTYAAAQPQSKVQAILDGAVESAVSEFSWALRPMVRPKLAPLATACPSYDVHIDGPAFRIQCKGKDPFEWTVGKSDAWTSPDGRQMTVTLRQEGARFHLDFVGKEGGKTYIYDFAGDGLVVTQKIYADKLPSPMQWTLSYRTP